MPKIVSNIPGRLRLRAKMWRTADFAQFEDKIQNLAGVQTLQTNPKTKSVLIFVHPSIKTLPDEILAIARQMRPVDSGNIKKSVPTVSKSRGRQRYRARVNQTMLTTLAASLWALTVRNTKLHAITGFGFAGVLFLHLFEHRRILKKQIFF